MRGPKPEHGDGNEAGGEASRKPEAPLVVDERAVTGRFPPMRRPRPPSVMVVDDSEDAQELMRTSLEAAGYRVLSARNGKEALEILIDRATPVAVVVDLFMPVMDGFELMGVLRSYSRLAEVPVIVVSASDGQVAFKSPRTSFLQKPFSADQLLAALEGLRDAAAEPR